MVQLHQDVNNFIMRAHIRQQIDGSKSRVYLREWFPVNFLHFNVNLPERFFNPGSIDAQNIVRAKEVKDPVIDGLRLELDKVLIFDVVSLLLHRIRVLVLFKVLLQFSWFAFKSDLRLNSFSKILHDNFEVLKSLLSRVKYFSFIPKLSN